MTRRSLTDRVETLEITVEDLRKGAAQVDTITTRLDGFDVQFVQLRGEMRVEFSTVRQEMSAEFSAVRQEMSAGFGKLSEEIQHGDEETRRFMRVLYEDLVAKIAIQGERSGPQ